MILWFGHLKLSNVYQTHLPYGDYVPTISAFQRTKKCECIALSSAPGQSIGLLEVSKASVSHILNKGKSVPLQAWSGPEGSRKLRFPDYMTTARDGGKVVSLTHRPPLPPRKYSCHSFLLEAESTPGPQCDRKDFMSMKIPLTPAGIELATFRIVTEHLNHCTTAVPIF